MISMKKKIEVTNYKKIYQNKTVIIDDIVIDKRVNLLIGKNGCGKSTLLKSIANLISYEGNIKIDSKTCYMSETVSYPEDISLFDFIDNLNKISKNNSLNEEINYLLNLFHLEKKLHNKINTFSKGMKVKVNIIQCLMEKADIYLLDEPLSGLDKKGVACLIEYIKKSSKMFVISTHLNNDFKEICDEVFYL